MSLDTFLEIFKIPATEQWITTYIEVLGTLLVFVLGILPLIRQVQDSIYNSVQHRARGRYYRSALIIGSLVWILFSIFSFDNLSNVFLIHTGFIIIFTATILYSIYIYKYLDINNFISWSIKENKRDINERYKFDETLEDLLSVGQKSENSNEKEAILQALNKLSHHLLDKHSSSIEDERLFHNKENFRKLMEGFVSILTDNDRLVTAKNFESTSEILYNLISRIMEIEKNRSNSDIYRNKTIHTTKVLLISFLQRFPDQPRIRQIFTKYLNIIKKIAEESERESDEIIDYPAIADAFFEIGVIAITIEKYLLSAQVLNEFIFSALADGKIETHEGTQILGLIAHWWCHNEGGKRMAQRALNAHKDKFTPDLETVMEAAITTHEKEAHLVTVSRLLTMQADLFPPKDTSARTTYSPAKLARLHKMRP